MAQSLPHLVTRSSAAAHSADATVVASTRTASDMIMADVIDRLSKLGELHDRGVLTEDEFAAQQAKLLGSRAECTR